MIILWEQHGNAMATPQEYFGNTMGQISPDTDKARCSKYGHRNLDMYRYVQTWPDMPKYGQICPDIVRYVQMQSDSPNMANMARYVQILPNMLRYSQVVGIWLDLSRYCQIRADMARQFKYGQICLEGRGNTPGIAREYYKNANTLGILWECAKHIIGILWEYCRNSMGTVWEYKNIIGVT